MATLDIWKRWRRALVVKLARLVPLTSSNDEPQSIDVRLCPVALGGPEQGASAGQKVGKPGVPSRSHLVALMSDHLCVASQVSGRSALGAMRSRSRRSPLCVTTSLAERGFLEAKYSA